MDGQQKFNFGCFGGGGFDFDEPKQVQPQEGEGFYFGIQTSANINTNPRTEQGSITVDRGIFDFYKEYFDGIKSFVKM